MISYDEAISTILGLAESGRTERVPLMEAEGRILAGPIEAPWDLPRFNNSSMDGFAVRTTDYGRGPFRITGESAAGRAFEGKTAPGEGIRVSTGAEVPAWFDVVIPIERAKVHQESPLMITDQRTGLHQGASGQYIRKRGSDVRKGQQLFDRGTTITPEVVAFLAFYNIPEVEVFKRPRVGIFTSGDEIRAYGEQLTGTQIVGSSIYYLERTLRACNCEPRIFEIARDEKDDFRRKFSEALEWSEILVTTAGVSVGPHDLMPKLVTELGGKIHFHKVAVRPGKPMMVVSYGDKIQFGLPGNPVSTCANTEIFVKPFLRRTFGIEPAITPTEKAKLVRECPVDAQRLFFVYAQLSIQDGERVVRPLDNQSSGNILNPALANALVVVPPAEQPIYIGNLVDVMELKPSLRP